MMPHVYERSLLRPQTNRHLTLKASTVTIPHDRYSARKHPPPIRACNQTPQKTTHPSPPILSSSSQVPLIDESTPARPQHPDAKPSTKSSPQLDSGRAALVTAPALSQTPTPPPTTPPPSASPPMPPTSAKCRNGAPTARAVLDEFAAFKPRGADRDRVDWNLAARRIVALVLGGCEEVGNRS